MPLTGVHPGEEPALGETPAVSEFFSACDVSLATGPGDCGTWYAPVLLGLAGADPGNELGVVFVDGFVGDACFEEAVESVGDGLDVGVLADEQAVGEVVGEEGIERAALVVGVFDGVE